MQPTVTEIASIENQINLFFHNHSLGKLLRQTGAHNEAASSTVDSVGFSGAASFDLSSVVGVSADSMVVLLSFWDDRSLSEYCDNFCRSKFKKYW